MVSQDTSDSDSTRNLTELLGRYKVNFIIDVYLVHDFNRALPNTIKQYQKMVTERVRNKYEKLDEKGKQEYHKAMSDLKGGTKITAIKFDNPKVDNMFVHLVVPAFIKQRFPTFVREMGIVYMIAKFEDFVSNVLTAIFAYKPDLMKFSKKNISYEELFNYTTVESLRKMIIEKEVRTLINETIDDINDYFIERFSFDLRKQKDWDEFKEIFYRRNIIIHNNGYPNDLYRKKTGYQGPNELLEVDEKYLKKTIRIFAKYSEMLIDFLVEKFERTT